MSAELAWMIVAVAFILAAAGVLLTRMALEHRRRMAEMASAQEIARLESAIHEVRQELRRMHEARGAGVFLSEMPKDFEGPASGKDPDEAFLGKPEL